MILLDFFKQEVRLDTRRIVIALLGAGLANAALLVIINVSAEQAAETWSRLSWLFGYTIALLAYLFAQRFTLDQSITAVEQALARMRIRLFNKICQKPLDFIEQYAEVSDYTPLVKDSNLLAQGTTQFILAIQNGIVLILAMIYLAFLSATTLYTLLAIVVLTIPFYHTNFIRSRLFLQAAARYESKLLHDLQKIRAGFKQAKLDTAEGDGVLGHAWIVNQQASQSRVSFNENMVNNIIFSNAIFYIFLLIIVFILPLFITEHEVLLYQIISTVLFIMVPVLMLVLVVPMLARTTQNLQSLYRLEDRLDAAPVEQVLSVTEPEIKFKSWAGLTSPTTKGARATPLPLWKPPLFCPRSKLRGILRFNTLRLEQVAYQYTDQHQQGLVTVGPFDLTLRQSEVVLIVGENGSGKSTLLKLLSGLYRPYSGKLYLNDRLVQCEQVYQQYIGLFSAVFADFHLFDRLYGLTEDAVADIPFWLQQMQLEDVVSFADGRFSSVHLSTGLRKRLACVVALLQRRPICVFDEVTADQDPAFRQHFYHQILPLLKQRGYTVVLVSHDVNYRHCADRLIRLDQGRIIEDLVLNKQH